MRIPCLNKVLLISISVYSVDWVFSYDLVILLLKKQDVYIFIRYPLCDIVNNLYSSVDRSFKEETIAPISSLFMHRNLRMSVPHTLQRVKCRLSRHLV